MILARFLLAGFPLSYACVLACALFAGSSTSAKTVDQIVQRKIGERYGDCLAKTAASHDKAVAYLISGTLEDGKKMEDTKCFDRAVKDAKLGITASFMIGPLQRRSYVANGLVRNDFANSGPVSFATTAKLDDSELQDLAYVSIPKKSSLTQDERKATAEAAMTSWPVGECMARRSPGVVRRLALTAFGSTEEASVMRDLMPIIGDCLPPAVTVRFSKDMLRDAAVVAYARLAYASHAIATEKNK